MKEIFLFFKLFKLKKKLYQVEVRLKGNLICERRHKNGVIVMSSQQKPLQTYFKPYANIEYQIIRNLQSLMVLYSIGVRNIECITFIYSYVDQINLNKITKQAKKDSLMWLQCCLMLNTWYIFIEWQINLNSLTFKPLINDFVSERKKLTLNYSIIHIVKGENQQKEVYFNGQQFIPNLHLPSVEVEHHSCRVFLFVN